MQFTKFGHTGLTVSRMILGTGTFGKQTDEKEAHRMLDRTAEAGINFIDTADVYPPGAEVGGAEIVAVRWLINKRAGFILATKGSKEKVALRNGFLLASLTIQPNAGPIFFGKSRRATLRTSQRKR